MRSRPSSESVNDHDDSINEFDASTCSGDNFYNIFSNEEEIIPEDPIVWINNNKTIWEVRVIKIPFSGLPEDSNYLKLKWNNTKKKNRVLIINCSKEYKQKIIPR